MVIGWEMSEQIFITCLSPGSSCEWKLSADYDLVASELPGEALNMAFLIQSLVVSTFADK